MDQLTPEERSSLMARIGTRDTQPERVVRSILHRLGYRFRLNRKDILGKPDITLPRYRALIFVHGCFWHRHPECWRGRRLPGTNGGWWETKLQGNVERDLRTQRDLAAAGWYVLVVWSCETKKPQMLAERLAEWLDGL